MRKELKAVVAAVLAVWLFLMGFEIGSFHEKRAMQTAAEAQSQQTQQTIADVQPQTQLAIADATTKPTEPLPAAEEPTEPASNGAGDFITTYPANETLTPAGNKQTTAAVTTTRAPEKEDPAKLSKAQVLQRVGAAVNDFKNTKTMSARRQQITTLNLVECSVPAALSLLNSVVDRLEGETITTYAFVGGKATGLDETGKAREDEGEVSPMDVIPPAGKSFTLTEAGVVSATAQQAGADTVYTVKLKEERATLQSPVPRYNGQAIGYLNLDTVDVSGVTFQEADMHYPGSTLVLTVNAQGRVTKLQVTMPMDGTGKAKLGPFSGSATFEGSQVEIWTVTY